MSAGNVSQLCADLLIHTLALRQIGIFDPSYYVPVVGGQDGQTAASISTPMERMPNPYMQPIVPFLTSHNSIRPSRRRHFCSTATLASSQGSHLNKDPDSCHTYWLLFRIARQTLFPGCSKRYNPAVSALFCSWLARTNQLGRMPKWGNVSIEMKFPGDY